MSGGQVLILVACAAYLGYDGRLTRRTGGSWLAVAAGVAIVFAGMAIAVGLGSPLGLLVATVILLVETLSRDRWVPRFGQRPEATLFATYRRYHAAVRERRAAATDTERERAHRSVLDELDRMELSRSSNTGRLIDLLRRSYAMQTDPTAASAAVGELFADLDREMIRVWGPPDGRGIRL